MDLRDGKNSTAGIVVLSIICLVLQVAVAPNIGPLSGLPNLALVLTCCMAMSEGGSRALVAGFASGLVYDLSCGTPLGLMSLELVVCAYALGYSGRNRFAEGWADVAQAYGVACLAVCFVQALAMLAFGASGALLDTLAFRFLPSCAVNAALFAPFALWYMRQVVAGSSLGLGAKGRRGRFDTPGL